MCSLSFIPRSNGYLLAMNRDERLSREVALPATVSNIGNHFALFPYESSGGTWIGANDSGVALALLNRNVEEGSSRKLKSRGRVIPQLLVAGTAGELQTAVRRLDLIGTLPFKLVAFIPDERTIIEWNWDATQLRSIIHPWTHGHWFSSGLSDSTAARKRGAVCQAAWKRARPGTLTWLRQLHRSHRPTRGAFSICVHREDAQTVSYTELSCGERLLKLRYRPGPPCQPADVFTARLDLRQLKLAVNFSAPA
jgi:hypothetical protein